MVYQMLSTRYNLLRKKIKPRDLMSTEDKVRQVKVGEEVIDQVVVPQMETRITRSFVAPHTNLTPHRWVCWYINNMLGLPEGTITDIRVKEVFDEN